MTQATSSAEVHAKVKAQVISEIASPATAELLQSLSDLMRTVRRLKAHSGGGTPLLMWLDHEGPVRARDVAEAFDLDQSTVSRHISALEADGFVRRTSCDDDRRAQLLEITAAGRAKLAAGLAARAAAYESVVADWPDHDVTELARLLSKLAAGLESAHPAINQKEPHS